MTTQIIRRIGRAALMGGLCLLLAGCAAREYSREELSETKVSTNTIDQTFVNKYGEVWTTDRAANGRVTMHSEGVMNEEQCGIFVTVYKDLPENSASYTVEYSKKGEVLQREVHIPYNQDLRPMSETRSNGKTSYEVENWELK